MNKFHWFEAKQMDRVTNYSSRIEPIRYALINNITVYYYCTFAKYKKSFEFDKNIKYLGFFRNRYIKAIEFQLRVIFKAIMIVLKEKQSVIMVNQNLIKHMLPAIKINNHLNRKNKFITDVRTTPTLVESFNADMKSFHHQFKYAVKYFNGYSFISPFMEKYIMNSYNLKNYRSVNWSSGVDINLFNPKNCNRISERDTFQLFYHGGISISRGNLNLVMAAHNLVKEGYKIELVQVGILVDKEIRDYINDNQISDWCKLMPPVPLTEIPQMIHECDLPVLPFPNFIAWRVSSPIKLMEYLAMGKKVLAPNMESFTDVFGKYSDIVFYYDTNSSNNTNAIEEELKNIIDSNLLVDFDISKAREFVTKKNTWEKQASNLFEFCNGLWVE